MTIRTLQSEKLPVNNDEHKVVSIFEQRRGNMMGDNEHIDRKDLALVEQRLANKIDVNEAKLSGKIDTIESKLSGNNDVLSAKIDSQNKLLYWIMGIISAGIVGILIKLFV